MFPHNVYSEPSLQRQHLFPKTLPLKCICSCTEYLLSRLCVPCDCTFSYNFKPILLKLCTCFCPGLQKCTWFGYDFKFIFGTFSTLTLSFYNIRFYESVDCGYFLSPTFHASYEKMHIPAGNWRKYNVASTSMQRHDVASTLRRRYIYVMCLPGCFRWNSYTNFLYLK